MASLVREIDSPEERCSTLLRLPQASQEKFDQYLEEWLLLVWEGVGSLFQEMCMGYRELQRYEIKWIVDTQDNVQAVFVSLVGEWNENFSQKPKGII